MSRRTALVAVAVLVLVLALEAWVIWVREPARPTAKHPVLVSDVTQSAAVAAAGEAVTEILSTTWEDYDDQAAGARRLMTPEFGNEYAKTSDEIKDAFVKAKTEVKVDVAWAGVHRAGEEQVQALLFLDQVVTRDGGNPRTVPFRALVTVVPKENGKGWLVADIDTR